MKNAKIGIGAALAVLALIFTAAVRMVDAAPVGPAGTSVGFSHVNLAVHEALGVHMAWYTLTQLLGMGALLVAFLFAVTGLIQLIRRRSLWKVDRELLALGCLYAAVFALYVLFEIVVINSCRGRRIRKPPFPLPIPCWPVSFWEVRSSC